MSDILHEAWNLLEPGERPFGMVCSGTIFSIRQGFGTTPCGQHTAYDRLCQAVEGVLLKADLWLIGEYKWVRSYGEYEINYHDIAEHSCRLTAAVAALRVERGKP